MSPNNGLIFRLLRAECDLSANQKLVLLVLLNHWNPNNAGAVVWPGQKRVAALSCLCRRTTQKTLYELEQSGLIKAVHESGKSNRYTLYIDQIEQITCAADARLSSARDAQPSAEDAQEGAQQMRTNALDEYPIKALRHSEQPRQREMRMLADILPNALQKKVQ